jgi:hypothetical protein
MTSPPTAELSSYNDWAKFWRYNIGVNVIPANTREKKPIFVWKQFQDSPVSENQFNRWLEQDAFKNGMAIIPGKVWHRPDRQDQYLIFIDFDRQRGIDEVLTNEDGRTKTLQEAAKLWIVEQHRDSPHKAHAYFYSPIPFPNKSPDSILGIEIKGQGEHGIAFCTNSIHKDGTPYEIIGTKEPSVLSELAARELIQHLDQVCVKHGLQYLEKVSSLSEQMKRMIKTLQIYNNTKISIGERHTTLVSFADSLLIRHLTEAEAEAEEDKLKQFFEQVNNTLCDDPLPDSEVNSIWKSALRFANRIIEQRKEEQGIGSQEGVADTDYIEEDDDLKGIYIDILERLSPHIYSVVSLNPPVMYIAHKGKRKIIKAIIKFTRGINESTTASGQSQSSENKKQLLLPKQKLIYAIPVKVIINNNPLDETKTYQVTFIDKSDKAFTIGPASINYIIEELANKGKVLRKTEAVDALTAILNRYEELGLVEVNELITQAGYFYLKGKFETYKITQNIDREPDVNEMLECTKFLDELSTKWHNKDIFPTVIKWFTLAPFGYIIKGNDRWLQNIHEHGQSSVGKTTSGKIGLAMWRLHTEAFKRDYQLRFGSIDSLYRFGIHISQSTYPRVVNEVGALREKHYLSLLEYIKGAIEAPFVRGKQIEGRYQDIPALCSMFFTSNPRPPDDSGYRSRNIIMHFPKDEVHERDSDEAKGFKIWLDSRLHLLGVLGDFIARYVIVKPVKPEDSILFSDKSHEDMAKVIIAEFYKAAGREGEQKPEWLDRIYEQRSIVEENTEQAYFELRGFLMKQITEAYSRHIRVHYKEQDPGVVIDFITRLNFCLTNKLIPYLHKHERKGGIDEILITHDIMTELSNSVGHIEGVTTMQDLAKEIPGFSYIQKKFGGLNKRVLAGACDSLVEFLEGDIEEEEEISIASRGQLQ